MLPSLPNPRSFDSFASYKEQFIWEEIQEAISKQTSADVTRVLQKTTRKTPLDFLALLSPAAEPQLETMARLSQQSTQKHFGKTIQMYIPLYLSNVCSNSCTYCGFSRENKITRRILTQEEILQEAKYIKKLGFNHILLVTGESKNKVGLAYLQEAVSMLRPLFSNISLEVQPLTTEEYIALKEAGVYGVYIYQETYGPNYSKFHIQGKKADYTYRIETPDRLGKAKINRIGLACLLGLDDWRVDSWFTGLHLYYLEQKYWQTSFSISFPRIREAAGGFKPHVILSDANLLHLICAYRLFNATLELSLSTRESPYFRDHVCSLGITSFSAGSKTNPGGYVVAPASLEQFAISDERTPQEIASMLALKGYEAVWKNWDSLYN